MIIKKYSLNNKIEEIKMYRVKHGGVNMAVMAKPINAIFQVREDKVEEFLNLKRDNKVMDMILKKAACFNKEFTQKGKE